MNNETREFPRLPGYHFLRLLGKGAMGQVYECLEESSERRVAVKVLKPEHTQNPEANKTFEQEAQLVARLKHENIVGIYNLIPFDRQYFLIMEYCEGEPLSKILKHGPLPLPRVLKIIEGLLEALCYVHGKHIVHHDIKPGNIMLLPGDHPILCDFGLSKIKASDSESSSTDIFGTPAYMSPEKIRGEMTPKNEPQSDLFALGVLFYEMATGELPFKGETRKTLFHQITHSSPLQPIDINPSLPLAINAMITHLLKKNPTSRYPSAKNILADLQSFQSNRTISILKHAGLYRLSLLLLRRPTQFFLYLALLSLLAFIGFQTYQEYRRNVGEWKLAPFMSTKWNFFSLEKEWAVYDPLSFQPIGSSDSSRSFSITPQSLICEKNLTALFTLHSPQPLSDFSFEITCIPTPSSENMQISGCGIYFGDSFRNQDERGLFVSHSEGVLSLHYPYLFSPAIETYDIGKRSPLEFKLIKRFPFLEIFVGKKHIATLDLSFFPLSSSSTPGFFSSRIQSRFSIPKLLLKEQIYTSDPLEFCRLLLSQGDYKTAESELERIQPDNHLNFEEFSHWSNVCSWHKKDPRISQKKTSLLLSNQSIQKSKNIVFNYWMDLLNSEDSSHFPPLKNTEDQKTFVFLFWSNPKYHSPTPTISAEWLEWAYKLRILCALKTLSPSHWETLAESLTKADALIHESAETFMDVAKSIPDYFSASGVKEGYYDKILRSKVAEALMEHQKHSQACEVYHYLLSSYPNDTALQTSKAVALSACYLAMGEEEKSEYWMKKSFTQPPSSDS